MVIHNSPPCAVDASCPAQTSPGRWLTRDANRSTTVFQVGCPDELTSQTFTKYAHLYTVSVGDQTPLPQPEPNCFALLNPLALTTYPRDIPAFVIVMETTWFP